ncbi:MAG: hypothetical protein WCK67_12470 [bacterium]
MNNKKLIIIFSSSIIMGILSIFIDKICPFNIITPLPVIIVGYISLFCIINFIRYSKKTTLEIILFSLLGFIVSGFMLFTANILSALLKLEAIGLINSIDFKLNYATFAFSVLAGCITAELVKDNITINTKSNKPAQTLIIEETETTNKIEIESEIIEEEIQPQLDINDSIIKEEPKEEIIKSSELIAKKPDGLNRPDLGMPVGLEEITSAMKQKEENPEKEEELNNFFEEHYELSDTKAQTTEPTNATIPTLSGTPLNEDIFTSEWDYQEKTEEETIKPIINEDINSMFEGNLGDLPEIKMEDDKLSVKKQIKFGIDEVKESAPFQFIPENIRLANNLSDRKEEKEGKITSIGKLIVNERDIENLIELGSIGHAGNFRTNIVSVEAGNQSNEIFSKIKEICSKVTTVSLIDKSGFILKSNIGNLHLEQTIGAVAAHAFMTVQNYVSQLAFNSIDNIIFNTTTSSILLNLSKDKIYALEIADNNNFKTSEISEILKAKSLENIEIESLLINDEVMAALFVDTNENNEEKDEELKKIASISSSIFDNLAIFVINIQTQPLESVIIFEKSKSLVIKKIEDKLAIFIIEGTSLMTFENTIKNVLVVLDKGI